MWTWKEVDAGSGSRVAVAVAARFTRPLAHLWKQQNIDVDLECLKLRLQGLLLLPEHGPHLLVVSLTQHLVSFAQLNTQLLVLEEVFNKEGVGRAIGHDLHQQAGIRQHVRIAEALRERVVGAFYVCESLFDGWGKCIE